MYACSKCTSLTVNITTLSLFNVQCLVALNNKRHFRYHNFLFHHIYVKLIFETAKVTGLTAMLYYTNYMFINVIWNRLHEYLSEINVLKLTQLCSHMNCGHDTSHNSTAPTCKDKKAERFILRVK